MGLTPDEKARAEGKGWRVGSVSDFLGLTPEEEFVVEVRVALSKLLLERRKSLDMSQGTLATRIGTGQSRIAKAEKSDQSISADLLLKAIAATGATVDDVAAAIQGIKKAA